MLSVIALYNTVPCSGNVFGPELQFLPDNCIALAVDLKHSSLGEGAQPPVSASRGFSWQPSSELCPTLCFTH